MQFCISKRKKGASLWKEILRIHKVANYSKRKKCMNKALWLGVLFQVIMLYLLYKMNLKRQDIKFICLKSLLHKSDFIHNKNLCSHTKWMTNEIWLTHTFALIYLTSSKQWRNRHTILRVVEN